MPPRVQRPPLLGVEDRLDEPGGVDVAEESHDAENVEGLATDSISFPSFSFRLCKSPREISFGNISQNQYF